MRRTDGGGALLAERAGRGARVFQALGGGERGQTALPVTHSRAPCDLINTAASRQLSFEKSLGLLCAYQTLSYFAYPRPHPRQRPPAPIEQEDPVLFKVKKPRSISRASLSTPSLLLRYRSVVLRIFV